MRSDQVGSTRLVLTLDSTGKWEGSSVDPAHTVRAFYEGRCSNLQSLATDVLAIDCRGM